MATKKITDSIQNEQTKSASARSKQIDPAKELKAKKAAETKTKAKEIIESGILNAEIVDKYNSLLTTIEESEARIAELFGIEAAGLEFADVINAKNAYIEEVDADIEAKQEEAEAKLEDTITMIDTLNAHHEADLAAQKAAEAKERVREQENYEYDRDRERKLENDTWEDEKASRIKVVKDREEAATKRELEILEKETNVKELEEKVAQIPTLVSKAKEEGEADGKAKATTAFNIEKGYLKKDYENQITMKDNKIDMVTGQLADANDTIKNLQEKLDQAYNKIQEVSLRTVEGVNAEKVMDAVKKINGTTPNGK